MDKPRSLRSFLRPYRWPLAVSAGLSVADAALALARPWPLKVAVDQAIGRHPPTGWLAPLRGLSAPTIALLAAAVSVGLVVMSGVVSYLAEYLVGAAAELIGTDIRTAAFAKLQRLSLRFHEAHRTGDLVTRLTSDVGRVQDALVAGFEIVLPETLSLVGMVVLVFTLDPGLGLAALAVAPLLLAHVVRTRARLRRAQRHNRTLYGDLASRASEVLRHVRVVQAFSRETDEEERFRQHSRAVTRSAVDAVELEARYAPTTDLLLAGGGGVVLWLGVSRVTAGRISLGTLLVVLSYQASLYSPVRSLARLASVMARGAASRDRIAAILDDDSMVPEAPDAIDAPNGPARLSLQHVSFSYDQGPPALTEVSLEVAAGESLCVVGPNGAGKSTLIALLLRLYDPASGVIELGGHDLRQLRLLSVRGRIAYVPQDPWIIDGTIAENIAFGRARATAAEIEEAARLALVDEFARRLPEGLDSPVGEGGALLSGGQRTRVALARAIVRPAPLLLLDEPTTGLDAGSEATVLPALARVAAGRTVVTVTHDLRLAASADRVVVLDGGRVVEDGSHAWLVRRAGPYAALWAAHSSSRAGSSPRELSTLERGGDTRAHQDQGNGQGVPPWRAPAAPPRVDRHDADDPVHSLTPRLG